MFVEVQETHVSLPGPGTIRRWRREAPEGFQFALLGPREVGQEGFRDGKVVETAMKMLSGVAKELEATTAIFVAPPEFAPTRPNKGAVAEFLANVKHKFAHVVFEPSSGWDPDETDELAAGVGAVAARDPSPTGYPSAGRLLPAPGPAGHKSRYEDPAIERLGEIAKKGEAQRGDVRVYQRRHVRRRQALQEGDEALRQTRGDAALFEGRRSVSLGLRKPQSWPASLPGTQSELQPVIRSLSSAQPAMVVAKPEPLSIIPKVSPQLSTVIPELARQREEGLKPGRAGRVRNACVVVVPALGLEAGLTRPGGGCFDRSVDDGRARATFAGPAAAPTAACCRGGGRRGARGSGGGAAVDVTRGDRTAAGRGGDEHRNSGPTDDLLHIVSSPSKVTTHRYLPLRAADPTPGCRRRHFSGFFNLQRRVISYYREMVNFRRGKVVASTLSQKKGVLGVQRDGSRSRGGGFTRV